MSRFPDPILAAIRQAKILGIRAGREPSHRFIGVWVVVVERRVFVRSWSMHPGGWWRSLCAEPVGVITVGDSQVAVRAARTRGERLKDLVSQAYREKYNTPGSLRYVRDMARRPSRDTTTELRPI